MDNIKLIKEIEAANEDIDVESIKSSLTKDNKEIILISFSIRVEEFYMADTHKMRLDWGRIIRGNLPAPEREVAKSLDNFVCRKMAESIKRKKEKQNKVVQLFK